MSSGTIVEPQAARQAAMTASGKFIDGIARLGLSPRQQALNELWSWYRCVRYDARTTDWDGSKHVDGLDAEVISQAAFIPPGFYDASGGQVPLKFRRPTAPYALGKVIPDRFTGLLFSERRSPRISVEGDEKTQDYVSAIAEVGRLWPTMIQARTYGGATGTVALGFSFHKGRPVFEVHDARWCVPDFKDRSQLVLRSIEKRYQYPVEQRNMITGRWEEIPHWYRRVIDEQRDTLYSPIPVPDNGEEPDWEVQEEAQHGYGFCPVVWIQNLPVQDSIDGDPDCHGIFPMIESIDALIAQGNRSTIFNCDPTLVVNSDATMSDVSKGSGHALKIPANSGARYMEISGTGPKAAFEAADKLRAYALEVAQCVLDHPDSVQRTAQEIERVYSSMLAKADILREQYGQRGVLPLLNMVVEAVRKLGTPVAAEPQGVVGAAIVRRVVELPPRLIPQADGEPPKLVPRELGPRGSTLQLQWGPYFAPSITDTSNSVTAAAKAKEAGLIDREHASQFVASDFRVEDVGHMLAKIEQEKQDEQARIEQSLMSGLGGPSGLGA